VDSSEKIDEIRFLFCNFIKDSHEISQVTTFDVVNINKMKSKIQIVKLFYKFSHILLF